MTARQLALLLIFLLSPLCADAATLEDEVLAFLQVPSVVGREEPAAELLEGRLAGLPVRRDALGNVVVTLGSGSPRRLVACPMGEPGYVVTRIHDNGYLRLMPASGVPTGALWDQSHQGQTVVIGGARGWVAGAVVLPSVHLMQGRSRAPEKPVAVDDLWVDVGAESAAEVEEMGIRLLDAVALLRRPTRLGNGLVAAPSARLKGACIAAVEAARRVHASPGTGTTVFAWTALDLLNRKGLEHLVLGTGPFDEALLVSPGFGWKLENDNFTFEPLPRPGSGLLGAGDLPKDLRTQQTPHLDPAGIADSQPAWGKARVGHLGLAALYPGTPVEAISLAEVKRLADALANGRGASSPPPLPPPPALVEMTGHEEAAELLGTLISRYGVSGAEGPVREEIVKHLPAWAKPETDAKGNLLVTVGQGDEHVLFVAHMDEVGFRVREILADGRLSLEPRGGLLVPAWEAHAALVHGEKGPVPGVFEPREGWVKAETYRTDAPLAVYVGAASAKEAEALGIRAGQTTVTMPKRMFRIGRHRAVARGFDDRNGCTAQILALRRIDPAKLTRRVTFAWVVEEEIGLVGSADLAKRFPDLDRVHPVDTFVSSDSPIETGRLGWAPLGKGPVLRAMDNLNQTPRELIDRFLDLAERNGIPIQYGMTGGSSDGLAFTANGPEMLPFSWPGRYSHSPVEISDLRDVESLVRLIIAAATE
jgi:putative aminopeptidase FrvX